MRNMIDVSSWQGALTTLFGLVLVTLVAVGIRLLVMQAVQQRRERANRQINERLKTLISAYKTLGGSFTGNLSVDPSHMRELRAAQGGREDRDPVGSGSDRRRRLRDAVEAALSDVILLGTPDQVRLAATAANDMVAGRSVETAALVVSLRSFIREVLDLDVISGDVSIPKQGPLRPIAAGSRNGRGDRSTNAVGAAGPRASQGGGIGGPDAMHELSADAGGTAPSTTP
ncbi:MAG: hypothetical protein ABI887_03160 [Burkholderiales bacterium]